ncbi:MAG: Sec-independent protein translocase protein TatB [Gammaproteobacteria bacterium]|nr:Sec-independent protein translocase protein TatB [Gammaproteobacteria bacterium]
MFDIGFAELVIIGVVALLVIGPERLPSTIRTASLYLNRIRRGFNEIKQEVQQELHNDAVMRDLRDTGEQLKQETQALGRELSSGAGALNNPVGPAGAGTPVPDTAAETAQDAAQSAPADTAHNGQADTTGGSTSHATSDASGRKIPE